MTDYNKKLCDILTDINFFINPKDKNIEQKQNEEPVKSKDISNAIDNIEECNNNPNLNIVVNYIKTLMNNPKTADAVVKAGNKGLQIAKLNNPNPPSTLNDLYSNLLNLHDEIQDETVNIYNTYSNNTDSIISEQNKQYENFKFNKIYLFLFNLGIIFTILRNSYFKKTY
jgi:hypothetical protein